jgi:uncharacterized protein (TIGR02246 family)
MRSRWFASFTLAAIAGFSLAAPVSGDENAIRAAIESYVAAFNAKDLNAVADKWTTDATHLDRETGIRTEGRAAIQADLTTEFKERPGNRLGGRVERIQMVTPEVAKVEGQTAIGMTGEEPSINQFSAILVKVEGKWQINSLEEIPVIAQTSAADALQVLAWLEGVWVDQSNSERVESTFRWSPNRSFLVRSFVSTTGDDVLEQGTQIIGWDPRSQQIRSWSFHSDGAFGEGQWNTSGDRWYVKSVQTLSDGRAAAGTYVMARTGDDSMTIQLIGSEVAGEPQPSSEAVTIVRVGSGTLGTP